MFFVLDENHNLVEAYDKEGVLAVIEKAIADGSLSGIVEDASFVTKIKCCVTGGTNRFAFVSTAKYNELVATGAIEQNTLYYITDEESNDVVEEVCAYVNGIINGSAVPEAQHANLADHASTANKLVGLEELVYDSAFDLYDISAYKVTSAGVYMALVCDRGNVDNQSTYTTVILAVPNVNGAASVVSEHAPSGVKIKVQYTTVNVGTAKQAKAIMLDSESLRIKKLYKLMNL